LTVASKAPKTRDPLVDRAIEAIEREMRDAEKRNIFGEISVFDDVSFTGTAARELVHNLNRKPRRWLILNKNAFADIRQVSADSQKITFQASATVVATIAIL
jgi:hypothetical protein